MLPLFGIKVASVNDGDFVLTKDAAGEILALSTVAEDVLTDAFISLWGELLGTWCGERGNIRVVRR